MQPTNNPSRLESVASYILLATVILAPLAFWPSQYFALESVKTIVIALGTLISAGLFLVLAIREKSLRLPPRSMVWIGSALALCVIVSAAQSGHFLKSFFGQGFEEGTGSFLLLLLVAGWVAYAAAVRRVDRIMVIYTAMGGAFLLLYVFHAFRFMFGTGFASLGILNSLTSTVLGSWYSLGIYAILVIIIALTSILLLPMPARFKNLYWVLIVVAAFGAFIVGGREVWEAAAIVFLGLSLYLWKFRSVNAPASAAHAEVVSADGAPVSASVISSKAFWIPLVFCALAVLLIIKGNVIAGPVVDKLGAGYSELSLPWQMTLDVAAGELKAQPFFGTGPNRFSQAFLTYKPSAINQTDLWGVEFGAGFGLLPTFVITEGFVGTVLWVIFFIFFGILGLKSLRASMSVREGETGEHPYARFAIVSSFAAATFLWIMSILYVTPHALIYFAFVMTGLWLGASVAYGRLAPLTVAPQPGSRAYRITPILTGIALVIVAVWTINYLKDTLALAYFDQGLSNLTASNNPNPATADSYFGKAVALHNADVFWQGRAEASLGEAQSVITAASSNPNASTTQVVTQAAALINQAIQYAQNAIAADPSNYYNYLSAARVAEAANSIHMDQSYQAGVEAYTSAISLNPQNPSIYVSLARLEAQNNQLDQAIQTVGAGLQVKSNYLDSVFLLSQIEAAKGNLPDAITAAQFAIKLNPNNSLLYFQLGLFQYTAGQYADAAAILEQAVKLQSNYANAQYFLGLSYARLGRNSDAIAQFEAIDQTNPNNQEIQAILAALRAGKSLFAGATPALTTPPEKRSTPPLPDTTTNTTPKK